MAADALEAWNALDEAERNRVIGTISELAAQRAKADRDTYASNFTDDPRVEIYGSALDRGRLTVHYLFHWWEWCPAQSGSDWNYHCIYRGTASFSGRALARNDIEVVRRDYVCESDESSYDREAVLREVSAALGARSGAPAAPPPHPAVEPNPAIPLHEAVLEGRVLLVREIASWFASGGVEFARATAGDLNRAGELDSAYLVLDEPLTDEDLRRYDEGPWDSPREFFALREQAELEGPYSAMPEAARLRFKQAVALLAAGLLERMPSAVMGRAGAHVQLLRAYARQASPELAGRLVVSARAAGLEQLVFDAERRWEDEGAAEVVREWVHSFPTALVSLSGSTSGADAVVAVDALKAWLTRALAAAATEARADGVPVSVVDGAPLPADSLSPVQGWPLVDLIGDLDVVQTACVRRICVGALLERLERLPGCSEPVAEFLETADANAMEPTPEVLARADVLARRATEIGGSALFGLPLELLSVDDPAEIVTRTLEAERALAVAAFRELARGTVVEPDVERSLGDSAVCALESEVRTLVGRLAVRDAARPSRDLFSAGWRLEPRDWKLEAGVLHGSVSIPWDLEARSVAYTEEQFENFELSIDFKLSGGDCFFWFRLAPTALKPHTGYRTNLGASARGGLYDADLRRGPLVGAVPLPRLQVRAGGWTTCFIRADGHRISVAMNGVRTAECVDENGSLRGHIGIQLCSADQRLGRAWFKNLRLRELPSVGRS